MAFHKEATAVLEQGSGNLYMADCPTRLVLNDMMSRWGTLVLVLLLERTHRFSELARRIGGVSEKMLAQTLKALEADGLVERRVQPTVPPSVEYSLTALGEEGARHVQTLTRWIETNAAMVMRYRREYAKEREYAKTQAGAGVG